MQDHHKPGLLQNQPIKEVCTVKKRRLYGYTTKTYNVLSGSQSLGTVDITTQGSHQTYPPLPRAAFIFWGNQFGIKSKYLWCAHFTWEKPKTFHCVEERVPLSVKRGAFEKEVFRSLVIP